MRISRTILAFLVALSLAMLPMARAFVAAGDEAMASDVKVAAAHGCDHAATDSDVVVAPAHDCCDHGSMPTDHPMKDCPASAGCIAKCCSFYTVLFSETVVPSPVGGTESHFVSNPFYSQTGSPPYRPPRA
jgi:hypothetical protein